MNRNDFWLLVIGIELFIAAIVMTLLVGVFTPRPEEPIITKVTVKKEGT